MNSNKISTNLNYYTIVRKRRIGMGVSVERIRSDRGHRVNGCVLEQKRVESTIIAVYI